MGGGEGGKGFRSEICLFFFSPPLLSPSRPIDGSKEINCSSREFFLLESEFPCPGICGDRKDEKSDNRENRIKLISAELFSYFGFVWILSFSLQPFQSLSLPSLAGYLESDFQIPFRPLAWYKKMERE